ncbi:MAG: hypothetical protein HY329_24710 [Chloroflexi bacterium]|nr:hypothetical protein [Chloroflexota bacterium]
MATVERAYARIDTGWWVKHGVIGGIVAGIVFAMFEMIVAALMDGAMAFWMPLRMIGAIILGQQALDPSYSLVNAAAVGFGSHMVMSMIFGAIFALIVAYFPALARSSVGLIVAASVYGLLLWLVNFYLIAPAAGWSWFPDKSNPVVQFFAHTFFFGTVSGIYLDRVYASRRATE